MGQNQPVGGHETQIRPSPESETMTGAQASHLKMLAEEVREPSAFAEDLSRRETSRRIGVLAERVRLSHLPPHTD